MTRPFTPWSDTQRRTLLDMRSAGAEYPDIAARVGHSVNQCMSMYSYLRRFTGRPRQKEHNRWTQAQITRHIEIIEDYAKRRKNIPWDHYSVELGHSAKMCRDRASEVRRKWRAEKLASERALIRGEADHAAAYGRSKSPAAIIPIAPCVSLDHTRTTSIARFRTATEILNRIGTQGLTAGLLGDPLPGRSALDRKRAGIVEPPEPSRTRSVGSCKAQGQVYGYRVAAKITLATEAFEP